MLETDFYLGESSNYYRFSVLLGEEMYCHFSLTTL